MARHSMTHPLLKLKPEVLHKDKELPNSALNHFTIEVLSNKWEL
jgi:hypothetical protein